VLERDVHAVRAQPVTAAVSESSPTHRDVAYVRCKSKSRFGRLPSRTATVPLAAIGMACDLVLTNEASGRHARRGLLSRRCDVTAARRFLTGVRYRVHCAWFRLPDALHLFRMPCVGHGDGNPRVGQAALGLVSRLPRGLVLAKPQVNNKPLVLAIQSPTVGRLRASDAAIPNIVFGSTTEA